MDTLQKIILDKRASLESLKKQTSLKTLQTSRYYNRSGLSFVKGFQESDTPGIIAEFKRRSPSKGAINENVTVSNVVTGYERAGVVGISVLTDSPYFGGSNEDLLEARSRVKCPVLRKDFTIDPYQIHEAKAIGADMILLIARVLTHTEVKDFAALAHDLGLEVLLEIHQISELDRIDLDHVNIVGVNNRNLKTFETSIEHSLAIYDQLPIDKIKISESGLDSFGEVETLYAKGYDGFLIGERFMKHADPGAALQRFIDKPKVDV